MKVSDILKEKGADVVTVGPQVAVADAAQMMAVRDIGALVVTENNQVVGVVTHREVSAGVAQYGSHAAVLKVRDVMKHASIPVSRDESIKTVMALMTRYRLTHLPVLEGERLVGIVSIGDVVKHRLTDLEMETSVLRDVYIAAH